MNKNLIQEIKGINADLIQGKKDNDSKKDMVESMSNENSWVTDGPYLNAINNNITEKHGESGKVGPCNDTGPNTGMVKCDRPGGKYVAFNKKVLPLLKKMFPDITERSSNSKFIDITDKNTYTNYNLLTPDKKYARNKLLKSFLETDKNSDIGIQFQLNRERIRSFATRYGGKMVKLINNGRSDGFIYYITKFGDAIKKNGGMTNLSKTCNTTPININYEYLENYQYNKYRGNYLISTSGGSASTSIRATVLKVLDHTMSEFHPCGMEDSFVYVGLNKNNNHRHGLTRTHMMARDAAGNRNRAGCYNDSVNHGPRTILENKTVTECMDIASKYNAIYASAKVGKYSTNAITSMGINDYAYNKNGIKYAAIRNRVGGGDKRGQCILFSNEINPSYKYHIWKPKLEYLGCWGDFEDDTWGHAPKTRSMTWINRGKNVTFNNCKLACRAQGYNIWGLQYAVGPGKSGQCMCAHESQKNNTWGKYNGANNCTWDKNTGVYVGGAWSNAVYRETTNPRPADQCRHDNIGGNIMYALTPEKFKEDNLGKNAYIDREGISHDLSVAKNDRIFYLNDAITKNTASKGCSENSEKHYEIASNEWESLRINTRKQKTCKEKETKHDSRPLIRSTNALGNIAGIVEKQNTNYNNKQNIRQKNIINKSYEISIKNEEAQTIFNALNNPITSGFTNYKKNNLSTITNMMNNIMKKFTGKENIIEGLLTAEEAKVIEKNKILQTIQNFFVSTITFEAQRDFTHLDVTSKKQWMYFWGLLIISTLSLKFYIMAKK